MGESSEELLPAGPTGHSMKAILTVLALLSLSSVALADSYVVIVNGKIHPFYHAPPQNYYQIFFDKETDCIAQAAAAGGHCMKVPDEPDIGSPERAAWQKVWCAPVPGIYMLASQACIQ
jgi:hypothetical protein